MTKDQIAQSVFLDKPLLEEPFAPLPAARLEELLRKGVEDARERDKILKRQFTLDAATASLRLD